MAGRTKNDCCNYKDKIIKLRYHLGIPIATEQSERPNTAITYLGIEINTELNVTRLPQRKLVALKQKILLWDI